MNPETIADMLAMIGGYLGIMAMWCIYFYEGVIPV